MSKRNLVKIFVGVVAVAVAYCFYSVITEEVAKNANAAFTYAALSAIGGYVAAKM